MNSNFVCAACRKRLILKRLSLPSLRQCVSRISSTHTSTHTSPQIPPRNQRVRRPWTDNLAPARGQSKPGNEPGDAANDDFLHQMFQGRSIDHGLSSRAKKHNRRNSTDAEHTNASGSTNQDRSLDSPSRACSGGGNIDPAAAELIGDEMLVKLKSEGDYSLSNSAKPRPSGRQRRDASKFRGEAPKTFQRHVSDKSRSTSAPPGYEQKSAELVKGINITTHAAAIDKIKSKIGDAIGKQDASRMETIWAEIKTLMICKDTSSDMADWRSELYAHILWGFMSVRRPNQAIRVWNKVIESNIRPTVAMWDTMLTGFGAVRNSRGIEDIWNMMGDSGFKPDKRLWVTRIRALAASEPASEAWRLSMQAFEEMMLAWLRVVKEKNKDKEHKGQLDLAVIGDVEDTPKPSVEAVNGLVLALVRSRKQEQLIKILSWAKAMGIRMDTYTFNPIIRMALKEGNASLASKVLEKMHDLGIKQDIATYTVILQSLFRPGQSAIDETESSAAANSSTLGAPMTNKVDDAIQILEEIERSGLMANAYTYSTLISGLLKYEEGGGLEAAHAVIDYMMKRNIALSSQIYTSLITAHFASEEGGDVAGVVDVWERARADRDIVLDEIFFDRLIEGFAKRGEIGKMKAALAQAGKSRKVPGWIALTEAIGALCRAEDWRAAREIVDDVRVEEQSPDRMRKGKGKKWFWDTARMMGLGDEGVLRGKDEAEKAADVNVNENA